MELRARLHDLVSVAPVRATGAAGLAVPAVTPAPVAAAPAQPAAAAEAATTTQGVFVTTQSLLSFPVASAAVVVIWKVLGVLAESLGESKVVPLVASFVIGLLIYVISIAPQATKREKTTGLLVAIVNCFFLAASALGVDATRNP